VIGELLRRIGDQIVGAGECDLSDTLAACSEALGIRSALWIKAAGATELLCAWPGEGLEVEGLAGRVAEWADSLAEPLSVREQAEDGRLLWRISRWQQVWPLDLEGGERAIWVVESEASEPPDVSAVAPLLRVALTLIRARQLHSDHEVQLRDLRSAQELMGHIVDALPVGLYVVDKGYRIVAWNRKRETGTQGVAREDAIGKSVFEVLYRQPKERLSEELEEVFATDEIRRYEVESSASGERRFYRLTKVPMHVSAPTRSRT